MSWIGADLDDFPLEVWADSVAESPLINTATTEFAGKLEQRTDYGGPLLRRWKVGVSLSKKDDIDTFVSFFNTHLMLTPFVWTFLELPYYVRFSGAYSVGWVPPTNGQVTFELREMHPSEIIV